MNSKTKRILCIVPTYYPASKFGGPIQALRSLNYFLTKNNFEIEVVTTNAGLEDRSEYKLNKNIKKLDGIKTIYFSRIKFFDFFNSSGWHFSIPLFIYVLRNAKNFDVIYCRSIWNFPTIAAYIASKIYKKKLIIAATGKLTPWVWSQMTIKKNIYWRLIARRIVQHSSIHYVSKEEKELCHKFHQFKNMPMIIKTGTDKIISANREVNDDYKFNENDNEVTKLLFMGRIHHMKGIDTLIDVYKDLIRNGKTVSLIIAGPKDGDYFEKINLILQEDKLDYLNLAPKEFHKKSIKNKIVFTGLVEGDDKNWLYENTDIYCHFSRNEGFSNSIIEAMAFKKPIIISEGCYFNDAKNSDFGDVYTQKDDATKKLMQLVDNNVLREQMGTNAQKYISEHHDWEKISKKAAIEINKFIINS